jgi:hypothetical protein
LTTTVYVSFLFLGNNKGRGLGWANEYKNVRRDGRRKYTCKEMEETDAFFYLFPPLSPSYNNISPPSLLHFFFSYPFSILSLLHKMVLYAYTFRLALNISPRNGHWSLGNLIAGL